MDPYRKDSYLEHLPQSKHSEKIKDFLRLLSEDCPDDDPDCEEIVCPQCGGALKTVFGSLPLLVRCECGYEGQLRSLLKNL